MSLLMEALKKAEEAKRQAGAAGSTEPPPTLPGAEVASEQVLSALAAEQKQDELPALEFAGLTALPPQEEKPSNLTAPIVESLSFAPPNQRPSPPEEFVMGNTAALTLESPEHPNPAPAKSSVAPMPNRTAFQETTSPERPGTAKTEPVNEQQAVQNLFQAKQPQGAEPAKRKTFLVGLGLFTLIGIASIGIYFWLQLQPRNGLAVVGNPPPMPAKPLPPPASVMPPPQATPPTPLSASEAQAPTPVSPPSVTGVAAATPSNAASKKADVDDLASAPPLPAAKSSNKTTAARPTASLQPPADGPIRITTSKQRLDPALEKGYDAFQQGDLAAAKGAYETALHNDPNNIDALNGLAMTYLRGNRNDLAEPLFQRALEIDPRNSLAQASLSGLRAPADPVQMESRLKIALADQPDAPHLYFSLGNLYARQNRWSDAQQAYFRAMSGDPENPDYLFNLAVSLDRLHQAKLARQYYEQALSAGERRPAGFDRTLAGERLRKLQP
jgi:Tfp pilus assembly protein PilF